MTRTVIVCAKCKMRVGKYWWQDVPGVGDLCEACNTLRLRMKDLVKMAKGKENGEKDRY